jgi:hypothetical protein
MNFPDYVVVGIIQQPNALTVWQVVVDDYGRFCGVVHGRRIGQENVGVKRNRGFSPKIFFS